jgi:hypothetical protein
MKGKSKDVLISYTEFIRNSFANHNRMVQVHKIQIQSNNQTEKVNIIRKIKIEKDLLQDVNNHNLIKNHNLIFSNHLQV